MFTNNTILKHFKETREAQKLYFQTRWPIHLQKCKPLEYRLDECIRFILISDSHPDLKPIAQVANEMRAMQILFFTTRDRSAMREAKKLEARLDAMIDDLLHPNKQMNLF